MASRIVSEFLENSTIHGLVHISTAKSRGARVAWFIIVLACFSIAIMMITNSYKEWQDTPVSTTITTHLIEELDFPSVTVCPPKGSNTAVNHVLQKVQDVNFTEHEREKLLKICWKVFVDIPNKKQPRQMVELLTSENMKSILENQTSLPEKDGSNVITLKSKEREGRFRTPGFGDLNYNGDFYSLPQEMHYVLEFPDRIEEIVGNGNLIIDVQTNGKWTYRRQEKLQLFRMSLNMSAAEDFCMNQGGHLASVGTAEENEELNRAREENEVWLGGNKKAEDWQWLDGNPWIYQNWAYLYPTNETSASCLTMGWSGFWQDITCYQRRFFVCDCPQITATGANTFVLTKESQDPSLHVWWSHKIGSNDKTGIQIVWRLENGRKSDERLFESRELSGNVSTPGLGLATPPNYHNRTHKYTVVIELPHKLADVLGDDGAFVIDVDLTFPDSQSEGQLNMRILDPEFTYHGKSVVEWKNWTEAEAICVSTGQHLASLSATSDWQKFQTFINRTRRYHRSEWLGGKEDSPGRWKWIDGNMFSEGHWKAGRPEYDYDHPKDCLDVYDGHWYDTPCSNKNSFICRLSENHTIRSDSQLKFTAQNLSFSVIEFSWTGRPAEKQISLYDDQLCELYPVLCPTKESGDEDVIGGFRLMWGLNISNPLEQKEVKQRRGKSCSEDKWKTPVGLRSKEKYENMLNAITLAREILKQNISEDKVWQMLLRRRYDGESKGSCLNDAQIKEVIEKVKSDLNIGYSLQSCTWGEDLALGMEFYLALHFCSSPLAEKSQLFAFFESLLLSNESLATIVAAVMHNIEPRAKNNIKDLTAMNMGYRLLESRYNFSLGPVILPLFNSDELDQLAELEPPFMDDYLETIQECRHGNQCDQLSALFSRSHLNYFIEFSSKVRDMQR